MKIQNQQSPSDHRQMNNNSSDVDMSAYLNQPRPKSMQGTRSNYTRTPGYQGALYRNRDGNSTESGTVYGNHSNATRSYEQDLRAKEEARRRGNLAIRIMSGKNRPRRSSNASRETQNRQNQSQPEQERLAVKITEYISNQRNVANRVPDS